MNTSNQHVIVFEVKKNKVAKWKKWCKLLGGAYKSEVINSLQEEQVEHEMFVTFELNGKTYGLAYMEGNCLPADQSRAVNRIHRKKAKECLERVSHADILYSVKVNQ